jgi:hypothetical protein
MPKMMVPRGTKMAHNMVAETAKGIAGNLYETLMGNDEYWAAWQRQNPDCSRKELERRFIEKNWFKCVGAARATLVGLLHGPLREDLKDEIIDALSKDASLPGRSGPASHLRALN